MKYSACIEWLFADEAEDLPGRVRAAAAAGMDAVEFWRWSNKDLDGIAAALAETGLPLAGCVCDPMVPPNDPAFHAEFLQGVRASAGVARRLGARMLIAQAGAEGPGVPRADQRAALVACMRAAADILTGTGIRIGIEPLNTLVDHPGYFLSSTAETLEIIREIDRSEIGVTYDVYHSAVMGEDTAAVLAGAMDHIVHVHVADHPGRGDPGTGNVDLAARLAWIHGQGYGGFVGLEYRPTGGTAAGLARARAMLEGAAPV